jgi:hypothetical protein
MTTSAPQAKRVLPAPMDDAQKPLSQSLAVEVADVELEAALPGVQQASSELEQLLHDAAPEDRLGVLWRNASVLLTQYDDRKMSAEAVLAHVHDLADRFDLWGPARSNEATIKKITRSLAKLMPDDFLSDNEAPIDEPPMADEPPPPDPGWHEAADQLPPEAWQDEDGEDEVTDELSKTENTDRASVRLPPLTLTAWQERELEPPDCILGAVASTTSRGLITGPTGVGKSGIAIALGMGMAAGDGFLHWKGVRPSKVLYVDGEMSNRLVKQRVDAEVHRRGVAPSGFHVLCACDVEDFAPLNTDRGRMFMWRVIEEIGDVDMVIFDNVMSLIAGSMAEEGPWAEVMPFVRSLTRRNIGQIWIHHTGHRDDRSYGTKTREWQMDTVAILEPTKRQDTDLSFKMSFTKARERAPWNRNDFQDVEIALVDDRWGHRFPGKQDEQPVSPARISPKAGRFLEALSTITSNDQRASDDAWKAVCNRLGLIDLEGGSASARAQFSKYRNELIEANMVISEGGQSWVRR